MARIRSGDQVVIVRGEEKGKRGKVSRVLPSRGLVIVEGVNTVKRHVKQTPQRPGGILEVEAPIPVSKVALVDPNGNKATRVKYKVENGKKVRVGKSGTVIAGESR